MKSKLFLLLIVCSSSFGQQKSLSSSEFWQIVQNYHPVVKQTLIDIKQSNASLTMARGAFDPFYSTTVRKKPWMEKTMSTTMPRHCRSQPGMELN